MKELLSPSIELVKDRYGVDDSDGFISLSRFNLLAELYHYFPILRTKDKNISTELYYIMSSNKRGQAAEVATTKASNTNLASE